MVSIRLNSIPFTECVPTTLETSRITSSSIRCQSRPRSATVWMVSTAYTGICGIEECAATETPTETSPQAAATDSGARRRQGSGSAVPSASAYTHQGRATSSL